MTYNARQRPRTATWPALLLAGLLMVAPGCGGGPADSAGTIELKGKSRQGFDPKAMKQAAQEKARQPKAPAPGTP